MTNPENQDGKRIGVHPLIVIFGIIFGLWVFVQAIIPKSKNIQPPQGHESQATQTANILKEAKTTPIPTFKITVTIPTMNAISLLVPETTTDTQIAALLTYLRNARHNEVLSSILPPTTPKSNLDKFSIASIFIFSNSQYAVEQAVRILSVGANAPGDIYGEKIPYEVAMEQIRGHYMINLNNKDKLEQGTLGYGEEATGLYSRRYVPIF